MNSARLSVFLVAAIMTASSAASDLSRETVKSIGEKDSATVDALMGEMEQTALDIAFITLNLNIMDEANNINRDAVRALLATDLIDADKRTTHLVARIDEVLVQLGESRTVLPEEFGSVYDSLMQTLSKLRTRVNDNLNLLKEELRRRGPQ